MLRDPREAGWRASGTLHSACGTGTRASASTGRQPCGQRCSANGDPSGQTEMVELRRASDWFSELISKHDEVFRKRRNHELGVHPADSYDLPRIPPSSASRRDPLGCRRGFPVRKCRHLVASPKERSMRLRADSSTDSASRSGDESLSGPPKSRATLDHRVMSSLSVGQASLSTVEPELCGF
jgi:hypothetical protein